MLDDQRSLFETQSWTLSVKAGDTEEKRNGYKAGRGYTKDSMSTEGPR